MNAIFLTLTLAASPAELFQDGDYAGAALAAAERPADLDAQLILGKALYRMALYHSAISVFAKVLDAAPRTKHATKALEWLAFISRKTASTDVVLEPVARAAGTDLPDRYRSELQVLLARYHFGRGLRIDEAGRPREADASFAEVRRLTRTLARDDPFYASGKYL